MRQALAKVEKGFQANSLILQTGRLSLRERKWLPEAHTLLRRLNLVPAGLPHDSFWLHPSLSQHP